MTELLIILRMLPEIRALIIEIGRLVEKGETQAAEEALRRYNARKAGGEIIHHTMRNAGRWSRERR